MDDQSLFGSPGGDWRTRSPDADQEYFIDKMRMLKVRLRKTEEENRVLYRCLAEQKSDVKEALRDKCFVINSVQYEMSELKRHILVLLSVLADEPPGNQDPNDAQRLQAAEKLLLLNHALNTQPSTSASHAVPSVNDHQSVWVSRNKTLEDNFKKELRKSKELERQMALLSENLQTLDRDREDLLEKNAFIEEENNIQREQIQILEETVRDLEEVALRTSVEVEVSETQTEIHGEQIMAILNENVEEIVCLVSKLTELQQRNAELEHKYEESRRALLALHRDFHERGKMMSALENELNALKLRERVDDRIEHRRRRMSSTSYWEDEYPLALNFDASSVFLTPSTSSSSSNSSRSSSSNSSPDFEEDESGISLEDDQNEQKKIVLRKFIQKLRNRRTNVHDSYRSASVEEP